MSGKGQTTLPGASCPLPLSDYPEITLAHGAGGALTEQLFQNLILPELSNTLLDERHDGAVFPANARELAFTTDSYVIQPLEFPGGDIGHLAVCGTINDLAMCGARARHLSLSLIIEEGLPTETLWRIIRSVGQTCRAANVAVVTGDTKVVERGKGDGLFITMTGVGEIIAQQPIRPTRIQPNDVILVSGDIGRHGIAVLSAREGIAFETPVRSDCAPLHDIVHALIAADLDIHCMRDLTRGGLATALIELCQTSGLGMMINEAAVPVSDAVSGAADLFGLDPLYIANEGRFCIVLPKENVAKALDVLRSFNIASESGQIGTVLEGPGPLTMETALGSSRQLDLLTGEQLPRIC
ncbi:MAG: hydrogenase expression/formation protein HypE [Henriciella sp.]|nr:hydrogenase expression/formation protein HypE [Henriciella sp.]